MLLDVTFTKVAEDQTFPAPDNPRPFGELLKAIDAAGLADLGLGLGSGSAGSDATAPNSSATPNNVDKYAACIEQANGDRAKARSAPSCCPAERSADSHAVSAVCSGSGERGPGQFNLRRFLFSGSGLAVPPRPVHRRSRSCWTWSHADPIIIFFSSALGVVPTAALMGRATEELAHRAGPGIGGLLNVTFGNAPELIIALFALEKGLQEVVKASIIGSILGNLLLVMGAAMLIGGWGRERQKFVAEAASAQATMLLLATVALRAAGDVPARARRRAAAARRRGDELPDRRRADVVRGRDRAAALLLRGPVVLAARRTATSSTRTPRTRRREDAWSIRKSVALLAAPASPSA